MKLHLFILSALLLNAFALPVPDEEVSPVKPVPLTELKSEITPAPAVKPLEESKTEVLATEQPKLEKTLTEKVALPESAPDAEIAQTLSEKKDAKVELEKQARVDSKVGGDVKPVPVVGAPVAVVEAEKKIVDEVKPAVEPVGKNANIAVEAPAAEALVAEQKKDELTAIETAPSVKSELPIAQTAEKAEAPAAAVPAVVEDKKEEQAARQERGTVEDVKPVASEETSKPIVEALATPEVKPEIKGLAPAEAQVAPAKAAEASAPLAQAIELKTVAAEKPAELAPAAPAAGDIPTQQPTQEKALPLAAEKVAESVVAVPEAKKIDEKPIASLVEMKPEAPITDLAAKPTECPQPLKPLEEKPALLDEKKPEESKESKESKESSSDSKESEESKEDKSE